MSNKNKDDSGNKDNADDNRKELRSDFTWRNEVAEGYDTI